MFGIGNEGKGKVVFFAKLLVTGGIIGANANNGVAAFLQGAVVVAQVACLGGAARGIIGRVKVQYYFAALVIA